VLIEQNIPPTAFCGWKWKGQCLFCKTLGFCFQWRS